MEVQWTILVHPSVTCFVIWWFVSWMDIINNNFKIWSIIFSSLLFHLNEKYIKSKSKKPKYVGSKMKLLLLISESNYHFIHNPVFYKTQINQFD